ncbi:hypothetical protein QFC24_003704 [Naganishia onofrii]|uniref:Uncharacterized protein n=1 Tax=Naganishia onofrii TaxID=1851511 RepID=A0ACC2XHI8_9TREE|nr:hypothetical protein QFC24_003704 [Naganishia onofrii]
MPIRTAIHLPAPTTSATEPAVPHLKPTEVNLLPFHLVGYTGPAALDVYFTPRPSAHLSGLGQQTPSNSSNIDDAGTDEPSVQVKQGSTGRTAAFRGRQVYEHLFPLPEGYTGIVFSAPPPPTGRTEDLPPVGSSSSSIINNNSNHQLLSSPPRKTTTEGEVTPRRSSRKRKVGSDFVVGSGKQAAAGVVPVKKRVAKVKKPVGRFSLDDDDEDEEEDEEGEGEELQETLENGEEQERTPAHPGDGKSESQQDLDRQNGEVPVDEQGEETQVEVHVVMDMPLHNPNTTAGASAAANDTQQQEKRKLDKGDSVMVVDDEVAVTPGSPQTPLTLSVGDERDPELRTDVNPDDDITLVNTNTEANTEENTQSPTPIDTPTDNLHLQSTGPIRRLRPHATFSGISIWSADEPMYTLPSTSTDTGVNGAGVGAGIGEDVVVKAEAEAGARGEVDVGSVMAERDEFARALQEWRRVAEVVHSW